MKLLDRYIWAELLVPFLIGSLTVLLLFQANYLIFLFKTFSPTAVPWTATAQLLIYESPKWLAYALTMGTSLATALAVSRLVRESELTAIRSAGASVMRVIAPIVLFGVAAAGLSYYVNERVKPIASRASKKLAADLYIRASIPDFRSNVTVQLGSRLAIIGTVSRSGANSVILNKVLLYERTDQDTASLTTADSGKYQDGIWTLDSPQSWIFQGDDLVRTRPKSKGGAMTIREPITIEGLFAPPDSDELSSDELKVAIRDMKKQGGDATRGEIVLATRWSIPAACIVLALVSPIFSILYARSGAFVGVLLGVLTTMLYYNLHIISTDVLGPNRILTPLLAAWAPNIVFLVIGLIAIRKLE